MATPLLKAEDIARRVDVDPRLLEESCKETVLPSLATFVHPWREVFSFLLAPLDIDDINSEYVSGQEKRLSSLRKWKDRRGTDATYAELINALLKNGSVDKAESLCLHIQTISKELEMAAAQSVGEANITSDRPGDVAKKQGGNEINNLQEQFLNLQKRFLAELREDKSMTADTLLGTLYILPVELQVEYGKFLDDKLPTLEQQRTVLTIFGQLSRHFTFLDYGLLGHLIKEHGSEKLQRDMTAYVGSVQIFLDETMVQQLINFWPGQLVTPPHFEELKAVVYQNLRVYSMRQLDDLRKKLCSETHLSQMVLVLKRVGRSNSFTVSWLVPSALASQLMVSLTQVSDTFYEKEFICSILVNQQQLYCSVAMRERKFECEQRLIVLCVENIGDVSEFTHLLSQPGVDPNVHDQDGNTLLWYVSYCGRTDIAEVLITYGADVDLPTEDEYGECPLIAESGQGHMTTCSLLLEKGSTVDKKRNKEGTTALYAACHGGYMEVAKLLLEHGAQVDLPTDEGSTPLMVSSQNGHVEVTSTLIHHGADVNHQNEEGATPLALSSQYGHVDVARTLIHHGADVNHQVINSGLTALIVASVNGHKDVVETLLEAGAKPDIQDQNGLNSLIWATKQGYKDVVATILNHGANPNLEEKTSGWTPLHFAAKEGLAKIAALLLKSGANAELQDENGLTPFQIARANGNEAFCDILENQYNVKEKQITESQKKQTKQSYQYLIKILYVLEEKLLPSRVHKRKHKQSKDVDDKDVNVEVAQR